MKFLFLLGLVASLSFGDLLNVKNIEELEKVEKFFNASNGELKEAMLQQNPNFLKDVQDTRNHFEQLEKDKDKPKEQPKQEAQRVFVSDIALVDGQMIKMVIFYNNTQSIHYLHKLAIIGAPVCNNVLCSFRDNYNQQYFFNRTSQVLPKLQQILYGKTF